MALRGRGGKCGFNLNLTTPGECLRIGAKSTPQECRASLIGASEIAKGWIC